MATSNKLGMYLPTRDDYISVKRDISDNLAILDAAAGDMDIIINGNTASENVTSGQFVTVLNSTITGVTDGIYKAVANVAAGVPFVAANLTTTTSGALNELVEHIAIKETISKTCSQASSSAEWFGNYRYTFDLTKTGYKIISCCANLDGCGKAGFISSFTDTNVLVLFLGGAPNANGRVDFVIWYQKT